MFKVDRVNVTSISSGRRCHEEIERILNERDAEGYVLQYIGSLVAPGGMTEAFLTIMERPNPGGMERA